MLPGTVCRVAWPVVVRRFALFSVTGLVEVEGEVKSEKYREQKTKTKRNEAAGSRDDCVWVLFPPLV